MGWWACTTMPGTPFSFIFLRHSNTLSQFEGLNNFCKFLKHLFVHVSFIKASDCYSCFSISATILHFLYPHYYLSITIPITLFTVFLKNKYYHYKKRQFVQGDTCLQITQQMFKLRKIKTSRNKPVYLQPIDKGSRIIQQRKKNPNK